ncbi:MAG: hypothetical protein J6W31_05870 [Clostridia bacterium]|nr:hypothetical protein [Clostridia bacterium]
MKAVLISIQPKWCEMIASGKKTVEVRKTRPKLETPFKVYIYMTKGKPIFEQSAFSEDISNGKVIGEFTCSSITKFAVPYPAYFASMGATRLLVDAQLTKAQAHRYLKEKAGYAWHISDLKIYDKPRELRKFVKYRSDWSYRSGIAALTGLDCNEYIKRPPQSWMYVEEEE